MVEAGASLMIASSLSNGHIEAVYTMGKGLGFEAMSGPACRERDLVMGPCWWQRICAPG